MKINELEAYINNYEIKRGTTLILGGQTLHCIGQNGGKYLFDNGMGWSKADILVNIVKNIQDGRKWGIK